MNKKKATLGFIGAIFIFIDIYYRIYDPTKSNIAYEYIGIGTWSAGLIYYTLYQRYKEITSLLLGLIILHSGVMLLLMDKISNPKLLGVLVFNSGVVIVLGSGFSDYMKRRNFRK